MNIRKLYLLVYLLILVQIRLLGARFCEISMWFSYVIFRKYIFFSLFNIDLQYRERLLVEEITQDLI